MFASIAFLLVTATAHPPAKPLRGIATSIPGKVGVAIKVLETGEAAGFQATSPYPMQSVFKLPISMHVLRLAERGDLPLDRRVRILKSDLAPGHSPLRDAHPAGGFELTVQELVRWAIVESDNTACDVLLRLGGGPAAATTYVRSLGIDGIRIETGEREMAASPRVQYRNAATPAAMVTLLEKLGSGRAISPQHRDLLLRFMTESKPGAQRLKGLLPPGTAVAHKTGTSGTTNGMTAATNDVGVITLPNGHHLAIAVFVSDSPATLEQREGVIARIARAAWDRWSGAH
jgi:beta-lactamase class A